MWSYNLQFMIYKLQLESWCYHHIITYRLIFLNNESYSVANCTCIKEYFEEILLNILCFPLASCTWIVKCFGKMFSSGQFVQCLMFSSKILEIANVGNFQMGLVENYVSCHQNDCRAIGPSLSFSTLSPLSLDFLNSMNSTRHDCRAIAIFLLSESRKLSMVFIASDSFGFASLLLSYYCAIVRLSYYRAIVDKLWNVWAAPFTRSIQAEESRWRYVSTLKESFWDYFYACFCNEN